jgi:alcohol dehydrogenase class IV
MSVYRGAREVFIGSDDLGELFSGHKKAFVVSDPFMVENNMTSYITSKLEAAGIETQVYSEVGSDPSTELVAKGISVLSDAKPDLIIAFGGGSAIDLCKAMMFFAQKQGLVEDAKFVVVPTTSGTGSEVTDFSVITDTEKEIKYPLVDRSLMPDAAILDCELTKSVPPAFTAATGMDALTHAMEAIVSTGATDFSDAMAEKTIKIVRSYLLRCYRNGSDMEARQAMHNGATMAGVAFNNAGLGINHSTAHAIGAHYHIPHGKACAIMMRYVIRFNSKNQNAAINYARISRLIKMDTAGMSQSVLNLIETIFKFNKELGIPTTLKEAGVGLEDFKEDLDAMVESAMNDTCTKTNPRVCSKEEMRKLFIDAYFGDKVKLRNLY